MKLVKKAAKVVLVGFAITTMVTFSSRIVKLPPIQMLAQVTETVHLS